MKNIIYNAQTKETTYEEVPDVAEMIIETPQEPTLEERVNAIEPTLATVVDTSIIDRISALEDALLEQFLGGGL